MKAQINVTVQTVPHPDSQRLIDIWSRIVLNELLKREREAKAAQEMGITQ